MGGEVQRAGLKASHDVHRPSWFLLSALPEICRHASSDWINDNAPRLGAAVAFYTLLSLAPVVVIHGRFVRRCLWARSFATVLSTGFLLVVSQVLSAWMTRNEDCRAARCHVDCFGSANSGAVLPSCMSRFGR